MWVYHYSQETKRQSSQQESPFCAHLKKASWIEHQECIVGFDCEGIVHQQSIVSTNTRTTSMSQVKIYLKSSKKLLHVSVFDHLQGVTMSSLKSLLLLTTVGCFYAKSGDVAACRVVCIGLYLKSA